MTPYRRENDGYQTPEERYMSLPCGKCPECLKRRASMWSFRLRKEEEISDSALFVTLTYNTDYVPISKNGFMSLELRDLQLFFKRLRKHHKGKPIKYYAVGEYGTKGKRPHYHIILFNSDELSIAKAWVHPSKHMPIGHVDFGTVSGASIAYTIKYINKGRWQPMHGNDDRTPEFSVMSKRLGKNWLTEKIYDHYRHDYKRSFITVEGGVRIPLPRYYKQKLFPLDTTDSELVLSHPSILVHFQENRIFLDKQNEYIKSIQEPIDMTPQELNDSRRAAIKNFNQHYKNKRKDI